MTNTSNDNPTNLKTIYDQPCISYHAVDDFRARLLALLPLASGVAIFELLAQRELAAMLPGIGLFGVAITLGLLIYELKGIQKNLQCLGLKMNPNCNLSKTKLIVNSCTN